MDIEQTIKNLQHAMAGMLELQQMHADITRGHEKHIGELMEYRRQTEQSFARVSLTLAEITDKLNGLIGYVDGLKPPPVN